MDDLLKDLKWVSHSGPYRVELKTKMPEISERDRKFLDALEADREKAVSLLVSLLRFITRS